VINGSDFTHGGTPETGFAWLQKIWLPDWWVGVVVNCLMAELLTKPQGDPDGGHSWFANRHQFGFANGTLLAQLSATSCLTRLLVILAFSQFFLNTTSFEEFLEPAQGQVNGFSVVDTHPQRHAGQPLSVSKNLGWVDTISTPIARFPIT